ncbi:MAG: D-2-hydroxyacid dehydrogenase [Pseudomonadota bacterium]
MTIRLAMHERSWARIRERTEALGLDLDVVTCDDDGLFGPEKRQPETIEADYFWFSTAQNKAVFDAAERMKRIDVLQTFNAGLDNPFYARMAAKGTRICNSSAQGLAIAEYVFAQVMSVLHPIAEQREMQAAKDWRVTPFREISQQTWTIVGFGPIGEALAHRAKTFGAQVLVARRSPGDHPDVDRMGTLADLPEMLGASDVVVLACPLNDATRGLAGRGFFRALKPGAILVNIARGGVVDDDALIAALDDGTAETAILDVFHQEPLPEDHPFWTHPKVRMTPHTSFAGDGGKGRWDQLFLDSIQRYAKGEPLIREVDPKDI